MRNGVPLLRVDEVGEVHRIPDEEYGRVVADQIPVARLRVELDGESARIACRVGRTAFAACIYDDRIVRFVKNGGI